jgi:ferredoxin-thioredoxin reductase catalytic subunit
MAAVPELDQYSQALLRGKRRIEARICPIRFRKGREDLDRFLHICIISSGAG